MFCAKCGHSTVQKADNLFVCDQAHENWINAATGPTLCIIKDGKVLYGVRAHDPYKGKLDLPGGFLDLNETLEEAAHREALEEIGTDIEIIDYLGSYTSTYYGDTKPVINVTYVARLTGEPKPGDDLGGGELIWRSLENLPLEDELSWSWPVKMYPDLRNWYAEYGSL
jgi:NAD+ diphosphatase